MSARVADDFPRFLGDFDEEATGGIGSKGWIVFWSPSMTMSSMCDRRWVIVDDESDRE